MIFVSSFRPFDKCPPAIWEHQIFANRSWNRVADKIIYFNERDERMKSDKTLFIPITERPTIREMATFCGKMGEWSAILNADIYVPQAFRRVEDALRNRPNNLPAGCAVSRRYTMTGEDDDRISNARIVDHGLDFFAATPPIWRSVGETIGPEYTFGRIVWDNWMVNFFMARYGNFCYDLTDSRVIFHPQHEDRVDQNWDFDKKDEILKKNNWPHRAINA